VNLGNLSGDAQVFQLLEADRLSMTARHHGRRWPRSTVLNFYKALADRNAAKLTYVYTKFGANNDGARDYIANKVGRARATLVHRGRREAGMQTHMRTNT